MTVARDAAHSEWMCTVERPAGLSYLFFEEFQLQVKGAELQSVTLEASFVVCSSVCYIHIISYIHIFDKPGR